MRYAKELEDNDRTIKSQLTLITRVLNKKNVPFLPSEHIVGYLSEPRKKSANAELKTSTHQHMAKHALNELNPREKTELLRELLVTRRYRKGGRKKQKAGSRKKTRRRRR